MLPSAPMLITIRPSLSDWKKSLPAVTRWPSMTMSEPGAGKNLGSRA